MEKRFYVTTPIYYANGSPHIGHFLTTTIGDVLARYNRLIVGAENVYFTTGIDEHGTTVSDAAKKAGYEENIQAYVDEAAQEWKAVFDKTHISYDYFVRTTSPYHAKFVKELVLKMQKAGDIYKGNYEGTYCNGCEKHLTLSDLNEEGYCPLHRPDQTIKITEENYFFRLSKYANRLVEIFEKDSVVIFPESKKNEILSRLKSGVEDLSITRPKEKVSWGIEFPGDSEQTLYVWADALSNYISSLVINNNYDYFWGKYTTHLVGKDINWFHSVIWTAFLLSAGYPLYKNIFAHSFLNIGGKKISKSLGNLITPDELIKYFGVDGARYLVLKNIPYKDDIDVTIETLTQQYNADLANGLGNTVARVTKLAENSQISFDNISEAQSRKEILETIQEDIEQVKVHEALSKIWLKLSDLEKHINTNEPWAIEDKNQLKTILSHELRELYSIGILLEPFLPETANQIVSSVSSSKIIKDKALFERIK
ncbi:methionine--tRNA ligase [Candidatus Nomurabacteria bacterium]|uniref:Methionine--tRNA ligase n=1 Tax=candidate division WWE3 bacterium TaxID=2053526 RepID=A0A955E252_UNCKA|nr:methionine--tRNA ligase [candidate division WWE3 bacterium]MCB9823488.1 methionine--tRNA ligase [Candidatus Nomurabacteria bacterium]MCB9827770.1 methionine--tRNA ligase [Candidatus Nomurabacteria bacterium]HXK52375.1 methionine--tRNA ligase [bacterium]